MTVTFFSNFLNHHQLPFCLEIVKIIGDDFTFVSTIKTPVNRLNMGYDNMEQYSFNLLSYINKSNYQKAIDLGKNNDVVIIGSASDAFIKDRLKNNKLTFRYSERIFKKSRWQLLNLVFLYRMLNLHTRNRKKNIHLLCASSFASKDFNFIGAYPNKMYKWGYFPSFKKIDDLQSLKSESTIKIIYVSRLIDWKHPEMAVKLAKSLMAEGFDFHLSIIGTGDMENDLKNYVNKNKLSSNVSFFRNLTNSEVLEKMQKSDIFIFTSDRYEGWGAVLNEAMSSYTAVVVSDKIGAVNFLIDHDKNGLIFQSESLNSLLKEVRKLFSDSNKRELLSMNALITIKNIWNPQIAAGNFYKLSTKLLQHKNNNIKHGPCSRA